MMTTAMMTHCLKLMMRTKTVMMMMMMKSLTVDVFTVRLKTRACDVFFLLLAVGSCLCVAALCILVCYVVIRKISIMSINK